MTQALALSPASQKIIVDDAEWRATQAHARTKKSLWWSLAGFAASFTVAAIFPPAILPGVLSIAGAAVGIMNGAYAIGHAANEHMLRKVKPEIAKEGFVEKMQKRASRLNKIFSRSDKLSHYSLFAAVGLAAVGFLAAPAAPIAWGLYSVAIWAMAGTTLVSTLSRDINASTDSLSRTATLLGQKDTLTAQLQPSNGNEPSALANAPAPSKEFDKAVKGPTADAAVPAPVKAPAAPKP